MNIKNESLLDKFRGPGICECCRQRVSIRSPHHVFSRGAGGPDIACNLVSLCEFGGGGLNCHGSFHAGTIKRIDLMEIICQREGVNADDIEDVVNLIRHIIPPRSSAEQIEALLNEASPGVEALARKELRLAGVLPSI